jgi:hypothetical protein
VNSLAGSPPKDNKQRSSSLVIAKNELEESKIKSHYKNVSIFDVMS